MLPVRLFVYLSRTAFNWNTKRRTKTEIGVNVPRGRTNQCANFQFITLIKGRADGCTVFWHWAGVVLWSILFHSLWLRLKIQSQRREENTAYTTNIGRWKLTASKSSIIRRPVYSRLAYCQLNVKNATENRRFDLRKSTNIQHSNSWAYWLRISHWEVFCFLFVLFEKMLFWHTIWRKKQVILISAFLACPFLWHIDSNNDVLAYSLIPTHFFVALSVVCHICALRLNCSTDSDAIWQVHWF